MIMLIDDDVGMRDMCSLFLESKGFQVNVAANCSEALCQMRDASHELVISDCGVTGMSGVELCANLRADPSTARLPILLMSASMRRDVADGASCDAFLRKPFLAGNFLAQVRTLLAPKAGSAPSLAKA